jgi:hypothetical protein
LKLPKWIQQHNKTKNSITDQKIDLNLFFSIKFHNSKKIPNTCWWKNSEL